MKELDYTGTDHWCNTYSYYLWSAFLSTDIIKQTKTFFYQSYFFYTFIIITSSYILLWSDQPILTQKKALNHINSHAYFTYYALSSNHTYTVFNNNIIYAYNRQLNVNSYPTIGNV